MPFIQDGSNGAVIESRQRELQNILELIRDSGLFKDNEYFFLGCTPDGLISHSGLVEIKCSYSAMNMTPEFQIRKLDLWPLIKDGTIIDCIKKTHKYHDQVQEQMVIEKKKIVHLKYGKGIRTEKIFFDQKF